MRRIATLGFLLALTGCGAQSSLPNISMGNPAADYIGSPFSGAGGFIADTHTPFRHPNAPVIDSENVKRVSGQDVTADPLTPDAGNVWPGAFKPTPTLSEVARSMDGISIRPAKGAVAP
jgi:hypothetical protein